MKGSNEKQEVYRCSIIRSFALAMQSQYDVIDIQFQ
jgi:hypothetical protein